MGLLIFEKKLNLMIFQTNSQELCFCVFLRPVDAEEVNLLVLQGKGVKQFVHDPDPDDFFIDQALKLFGSGSRLKIARIFLRRKFIETNVDKN